MPGNRINPNLIKTYFSYTASELAKRLGLHKNTIRNWVRSGLPFLTGRFRAQRSGIPLSSQVPSDAFAAEILGTERAGSGVLIRDDGLVLTIGYLMTEAEEAWLTTSVAGLSQAMCWATTR